MEFLDPAAKRARTIRLFTGYALLAIVVALATTILVYRAQGFGYDTDKGVTRSGLLFVDAKPKSAQVTLDGLLLDDTTDARIVVPEGEHSVKLKIDNYREWSNKFVVDGGSVKYLLYPRLFPVNVPVGVTRVLPETPVWAKQSPDRRWLVHQQNIKAPVLTITDIQKPDEEPTVVALPSSVLVSQSAGYGSLAPQEWSDDNKHLLLLQTLPDGAKNYIQFDRENPDKSVNVTKTLKLTADQTLVLRDKKHDKFYVFSAEKGELRNGNTKDGELSEPFAKGVISFKPHADNLILYTTYQGAKPTEANVVVLEGQKNVYNLRPITRDAANVYLLDMAKFDGDWFYIVGSPSNELVRLYRNPLSRLKPNTASVASPQVSLRIKNPQFISFSDNTRFIAIQSGQQFVIYDAEDARSFRYTMQLDISAAQQAKWMDGHRLTVNNKGRVFVFDFDGTNVHDLVASKPELGAYFDRDYKFLYTFIPQADAKVGFQNARLILEN